MDIQVETEGDVVVATVQGQALDADCAQEFRDKMGRVAAAHTRVLLDLHDVGFVDSSGLGAILSAIRQLGAKGGGLKICAPSKPVLALFELVRFHRVVDILNSRAEGVNAFRTAP
jgi:anti-sigma B factor antagonist